MSETGSDCFLFAGPSLHCAADQPVQAAARGLRMLPPVRHGDLDQLVARYAPGVIAIADGLFHQCLGVGHAEIRGALARGWTVWGLASLGAIRAYEMRHMGVRGFGRVYECFSLHDDFRDDEVALLHAPHPPFRALTEPLVHLRCWLGELRARGLLTQRQEAAVSARLMSCWYGERTLACARTLVLESAPEHAAAVELTLADFERFHLKCHDLSDFLSGRVWVTG